MTGGIGLLMGTVVGAAVALTLPRFLTRARGHHGKAGAALVHTEATFRFTANAPVTDVAPLFGADRERRWAPDWEPRFLHPAAASDQRGMVFTVSHGESDSIWVNTQFDLARGLVQYAYVLPETMTTLITLHITAAGAHTLVEVTYERTALREEANAHVEQLGAQDGREGPVWERQINDYLGTAVAATQ